MTTLLQRIKTSESKKWLASWICAGILIGIVFLFTRFVLPMIVDADGNRAAQIKRVEAAKLESDKELECVLSGGKWKNVSRHGFVCAPNTTNQQEKYHAGMHR